VNFIDLLLGGAGGGIIGTIGSLANKWQEARSSLALAKENNANKWQEARSSLALAKENNAHEIALKDREFSLLQLKLGSEGYLKELERDIAFDKTSGDSLVASIESDAAAYSVVDTSKASPWLVLVDVIRGLMRPGLTIGLTSLNGYLSVVLLGKLTETADLGNQIILSTATLAGMSVAWWFGARSHASK